MKWIAILITIFSVHSAAWSQRMGLYAGYVLDRPSNDIWLDERGIRIGVSSMPRQFEVLPYNGSWNAWLHITGAKNHLHKDNIYLPFSDDTGSNLGFGRVQFNKVSFGLNYDLGYSNSAEAVVIPFITFGPRMDYYYSRYYQEHLNDEALYTTDPITSTSTGGFSSGAGIKFVLGPNVLTEFRWEYYGNWVLRRSFSEGLPIVNSYALDAFIPPTVTLREQRYNSGHAFSFNIVIMLNTHNSDN
jgi:hypothetical protein